MAVEIKTHKSDAPDYAGLRLMTEVGHLRAFDEAVVSQVIHKVSTEIAKAFMEKHGPEVLASLKLNDIKELAMLKAAGKMDEKWAEIFKR